jgi:hypothetical protein
MPILSDRAEQIDRLVHHSLPPGKIDKPGRKSAAELQFRQVQARVSERDGGFFHVSGVTG